jgi:hypothetical protein
MVVNVSSQRENFHSRHIHMVKRTSRRRALNSLWLDRIDSSPGIHLLSPRHRYYDPFSVVAKFFVRCPQIQFFFRFHHCRCEHEKRTIKCNKLFCTHNMVWMHKTFFFCWCSYGFALIQFDVSDTSNLVFYGEAFLVK